MEKWEEIPTKWMCQPGVLGRDCCMTNAPDSAPGDVADAGKDAVLIIDDEKPLLAVDARAL